MELLQKSDKKIQLALLKDTVKLFQLIGSSIKGPLTPTSSLPEH